MHVSERSDIKRLGRRSGRFAHLWPTASLRTYLFAIVLVATLPVVAPFLVLSSPNVAVRVSNLVALAE